jgi:hypothetical protein
MGLGRMLRVGLARMPFRLGRFGSRRFMQSLPKTEPFHKSVGGPHWYLVAVGARSGLQASKPGRSRTSISTRSAGSRSRVNRRLSASRPAALRPSPPRRPSPNHLNRTYVPRPRSRTRSMAAPRRTHDRTGTRSMMSESGGQSVDGWRYTFAVLGQVSRTLSTIPASVSGRRIRKGSVDCPSGLRAMTKSSTAPILSVPGSTRGEPIG